MGISSQNQALWRNRQTDSVSFTADQSNLAAALASDSGTKLFDGSLKGLQFAPAISKDLHLKIVPEPKKQPNAKAPK